MELPTVDWSWPPSDINRVLRAMFRSIKLDPATFRPLADGFEWVRREWRG